MLEYLKSIDYAVVVAILALISSILFFALADARNSRTRFLDNFGRIYEKTFSLRNKLSAFTKEEDNEEFFYEIDRIWLNEKLREEVLDYLTELENFFFLVVGHRYVQKSLERLMSLPLYERLLFFYGFILKHRQETKNQRFFLNYEKALLIISKMKKIRSVISSDAPKCYIGVRSSDRQKDGGYFQSDICIFADSTESSAFHPRPNQNTPNTEVIPHLVKQAEDLAEKSPEIKFAFYNGKMAYCFPPKLHDKIICLNLKPLLQMLNDKVEMKRWLSEHNIPILPYETFLGKELSRATLRSHFSHAESVVVQSASGGGGIGTYILSVDDAKPLPELQPLRSYLVSHYVRKSISVNTHVFIGAKQTVLSPGSVQLIVLDQGQLCYRGADFITFRQLPADCRNRVRELSLQIANRLRERGYRGVAGLDFLVTGPKDVYCMEVNPRYQASTSLLNLYLSESARTPLVASSVFELNEQAFANRMATTLSFDDEINYSCYFYYKGDLPLKYYSQKRKCLIDNGVDVRDDGFLLYPKEEDLAPSSYLFQAIFRHRISGVSPDFTLWLNDNVTVQPKPKDMLGLKIALLNQGAQLKVALPNVKNGAYQSIDISYCGGEYQLGASATYINCVVESNLSQYSPFSLIGASPEMQSLTYYGEDIGQVKIELDPLANFSHEDRRILFLATDRLRIKMVAGCEYKNMGTGCRFCNLPFSDTRFRMDELKRALTHLKASHPQFRHILIGGGTCLDPTVWDDIRQLCEYLKQDDFYRDKPISLMSVPPEPKTIETLYQVGLEEVAYNIEVADDTLAKTLMPGKRGQPKSFHHDALEFAVKLLGVGKVRCALLVGFDTEEDLVSEVIALAEKGVIPCLSALRSLDAAEQPCVIHPDNAYLRRILERCEAELKRVALPIQSLGPACKACQNNMLVL